jgi:hypothetical protein
MPDQTGEKRREEQEQCFVLSFLLSDLGTNARDSKAAHRAHKVNSAIDKFQPGSGFRCAGSDFLVFVST